MQIYSTIALLIGIWGFFYPYYKQYWNKPIFVMYPYITYRCFHFFRVDSPKVGMYIENFRNTLTLHCQYPLQPIHFYTSTKLQKINRFSGQLLELCVEWWGPQLFFMVNLEVLGWILHTWAVRPKNTLRRNLFIPTSRCLLLRDSLLTAGVEQVLGCQAARF